MVLIVLHKMRQYSIVITATAKVWVFGMPGAAEAMGCDPPGQVLP